MDSSAGERLRALEVQMKELIGNGQPGRIGQLEQDVRAHSRLIWLGMGGLALIQFLSANGMLKFFGK